jgi:hypothetical protein
MSKVPVTITRSGETRGGGGRHSRGGSRLGWRWWGRDDELSRKITYTRGGMLRKGCRRPRRVGRVDGGDGRRGFMSVVTRDDDGSEHCTWL